MIQLDTSFLIRALVPDSSESKKLRGWLEERENVGISALAWAEFQCGPVSAKLFNETGRRRGTFVDCMIAATAIVAEESLATSNPKDFARFEKLGLVLAA